MEDTYLNEFTKDWDLLDSKGNLELYSYFDSVEWQTNYAIKRNGNVVYTFENGAHGNAYSFFDAVSIIA